MKKLPIKSLAGCFRYTSRNFKIYHGNLHVSLLRKYHKSNYDNFQLLFHSDYYVKNTKPCFEPHLKKTFANTLIRDDIIIKDIQSEHLPHYQDFNDYDYRQTVLNTIMACYDYHDPTMSGYIKNIFLVKDMGKK